MKSLLIICAFFTFSLKMSAQDLPRNPKAGKCYLRIFEIDKKIEWKEVDCNIVNKSACVRNSYPISKRRKELKEAGYNIALKGRLDSKFIKAHNNYLKKQDKEKRKQKRVEKKT